MSTTIGESQRLLPQNQPQFPNKTLFFAKGFGNTAIFVASIGTLSYGIYSGSKEWVIASACIAGMSVLNGVPDWFGFYKNRSVNVIKSSELSHADQLTQVHVQGQNNSEEAEMLRNQLKEAKGTIETVTSDKDELEQKIKELEARIKQLEEKLKIANGLCTQINQAGATRAGELEDQLQKQTQLVNDHQKNTEELKNLIGSLQDELKEKNSRLETQQSDLQKSKEELTKLQHSLDELSQKSEQFDTSLSSSKISEEKISQLESTIKELKKTITSQEAKIKKETERGDKYKQQVREIAGKNIGNSQLTESSTISAPSTQKKDPNKK